MVKPFVFWAALWTWIGTSALFASTVENPLFSYTHMLPSPYTLPAGRVILGTELGMGVLDILQLDTNLLRDVYQIYNANGKLSLFDSEDFALASTLGFESFNYHSLDSSNPDLSVTSWKPGFVAGFKVARELAWFLGGSYNYSRTSLITQSVRTSGYIQGTSLESDLSWAYHPTKKRLGNVLATGVTYDLSYHLIGIGLSHFWKGFHAGIHYYPNASKNKWIPIIAGGAVVDL